MLPSLLPTSAIAAALGHPMVVLLLKATIILLAALGVTLAMQRRSAGARHLVWLVALATLLVVPALTVWAPLPLAVLPPVESSVNAPPAESPDVSRADANLSAAPRESRGVTADAPVTSTPATLPAVARAWMNGLTLALALWAVVVLAIGASLTWSALVVRRIVRRAAPLAGDDWTTPLCEVADRLELDELPRLVRSEQVRMPFACGVLSPTIVLPSECDGWSLDRRRAVLLHELAHVRRHDLLGHTLGRIACAVWWFHPLVWTAAKQLRAESERACDDLALSCGARATDYAEHLLDIVTSVRRDATPSVALAMARRKEFEGRMLAILDPELRRTMPGRLQTAGLVLSLGLLAMVVGAAAPAPRQATGEPIALTPIVERATHEAVRHATAHATQHIEQHTIQNTAQNTAQHTVQSTVESTVPKVVTQTVQSVVPNVVSSLLGGGKMSAEQLRAIVQQDPDKHARGHDDRPALLANVLKTETNPELRRIAAWGLSEYADQQVAIDALSAALRTDKDADVREMAAWALGEGGEHGSGSAALADALRSDESLKVRQTAAWALGEAGDRAAVPALTAALNDKDAEIRRRAIWALGEIGPKQAPPELIAKLKDSDRDVREMTAWALHEIEDPASVPALQAALNAEKDENLQELYIRALGAIGEKSVDAIRGMLTSSNPRIKAMAVRALAGGDATGPWPMPMPMPRPFPNER